MCNENATIIGRQVMKINNEMEYPKNKNILEVSYTGLSGMIF
jgi:hypothetical protein